MADAVGDRTSLEFTSTLVVAGVFLLIVLISIAVERLLVCAGQLLMKCKMWALVGAIQKIKDELMALGFVSVLLLTFQNKIGKICISARLANVWLPCKLDSSSTVTSSFAPSGTQGRRLLAMASDTIDYCSQQGKVALLSPQAIHQVDIFIFVLAIFHVVLCALKVPIMICQLKRWGERNIWSSPHDALEEESRKKRRHAQEKSSFPGWVKSSFKRSLSLDPKLGNAVRLNSFRTADPNDRKRNFEELILVPVQKDFEKTVGISWWLWSYAVIFLLVNVDGWNAYALTSLLVFILWLIVSFILEHMMGKLQNAVEAKVEFSHKKICFGRLHPVRKLIHIVLFGSSLELAFFFFIWFQYGFHSCIFGSYEILRVSIAVIVQVMCTLRTVPLYAIIKSQMRLKVKQSDEQTIRALEEFEMHAKATQSYESIKEGLDDLKAIVRRYKEEEMCIVSWIWKLFSGRKNSAAEAKNIDPKLPVLAEGSPKAEMTESSDMNQRQEIEERIDHQA